MKIFISLLLSLMALQAVAQKDDYTKFRPGTLWLDTEGRVINAHGGGIIHHNGAYYWFGEHRAEFTTDTPVGVSCYSSDDLLNWKNEGIVLPVSQVKGNPLSKGALIERPRVVYNKATKNFVMYFHLEPADNPTAGYVGVAVSRRVTGPYKLVKHGRINAGEWPMNDDFKPGPYTASDQELSEAKWSEGWHEAMLQGVLVRRDFKEGQRCADMTLFVDDNGTCYHIYTAEDGNALHIAELTNDYLGYTGRYLRVDPTGKNEAPIIFKHDGLYWLLTSNATAWRYGPTRLFSAPSIWGPWEPRLAPCKGKTSSDTFYSRGTHVIKVEESPGAYIFMADRWRFYNPIDSRYVWLPIRFKYGTPVIEWQWEWGL